MFARSHSDTRVRIPETRQAPKLRSSSLLRAAMIGAIFAFSLPGLLGAFVCSGKGNYQVMIMGALCFGGYPAFLGGLLGFIIAHECKWRQYDTSRFQGLPPDRCLHKWQASPPDISSIQAPDNNLLAPPLDPIGLDTAAQQRQ
jgi:hypothetical protein